MEIVTKELDKIKRERFDLRLREQLGDNVDKEKQENLDKLIKLKRIRRNKE